MNRRTTLKTLLGLGGVAVMIPAWNETIEAADTVCTAQTPTVTEGPYWVDEKLFRSDIRTDPNTGVARAGVPLALTINVQNLTTCAAVTGAYVDIWHCDAKGIYSDESTYNPGGGTGNVNTSGQKFLRGYQITDGFGQVKFTTIYPGWYRGRTVHIHFKIRAKNNYDFTSQLFFDDALSDRVFAQTPYNTKGDRGVRNQNDGIFRQSGDSLILKVGSAGTGYSATFDIGLDLT